MSRALRSVFAAIAVAVLLAACGQGRDDSLVDGATDRPVGEPRRAAAEDVGPPSPSSAAASPASGGAPADAASGVATDGATDGVQPTEPAQAN